MHESQFFHRSYTKEYITESFWNILYVRKMLLPHINSKGIPYSDFHSDDRVIVWYNVGQSGGSKG